jgi:hypothetical protein
MSELESETVAAEEIARVNAVGEAIVQLLIIRFPDVQLRMSALQFLVVNVIFNLEFSDDSKIKIADRLAERSRKMLAAAADVVPDGSVH